MNSWMENAACRNHLEPEMWFSDNPVEKAEAKRICAQCPVRDMCATFSDGETHGIWAGFDKENGEGNTAENSAQLIEARREHRRKLDRNNRRNWNAKQRHLRKLYDEGDRSPEAVKAHQRHARHTEQKRQSERRRFWANRQKATA